MNRFRGRSGAGSVPAHGLAPQNLSSDKHVDVCVDSDEDRGSTPLASSFIGKTQPKNRRLTTGMTTRLGLFADVAPEIVFDCETANGSDQDVIGRFSAQ